MTTVAHEPSSKVGSYTSTKKKGENEKMKEKRDKYEQVRREEKEIDKKLAIITTKTWFEKIPKEKQDKPIFVAGNKTFTPRRVLEEVEKGTEDGQNFARMLKKNRMEMAKGDKK